MTNILIRRIHPHEWQSYKKLRLRALADAPEAFGSDVAREQAFDDEVWQSRLTESIVFGAFDGPANLCGMAGLMVPAAAKTRHKGILWGMYVAPQVRDCKVGRMLLEAVINSAKSLSEQLLLSVVTTNSAAVGLYHKCGFEIYGTEPRALKIQNRYYDEHMMVLKFRP